MFAGFETTAGTLTSALTVLSIHPEIQLKMHQEAIKICGKNDPTYSHLNQLHYICAVVHETLRMFPPVSVIPKMVSGDQKLGQYIIPGETRIAVHVGAIHRNPINFEDPDTFKPERWIQEDGTFNNSIKLLTFSDGARACIGKQFARVEMVFAMCLFAQRWKWSLPDGVDLEKLFLVKSELTHKLAYPSDLIFQEI